MESSEQAREGKAHPLWLLGHLAFAGDNILNVITLGGEQVTPRSFNRMFAPDMLGGGYRKKYFRALSRLVALAAR